MHISEAVTIEVTDDAGKMECRTVVIVPAGTSDAAAAHQAGIPDDVGYQVVDRTADQEQVARHAEEIAQMDADEESSGVRCMYDDPDQVTVLGGDRDETIDRLRQLAGDDVAEL
jgi:hypothetical protein